MSVPTPPNITTGIPDSSRSSIAPHTEPPRVFQQGLDARPDDDVPQIESPVKPPPRLAANVGTRDEGKSARGQLGDSSPVFRFPSLYSFPPFFTLQTNLTTRASQLDSWMSLVLGYCSHHRIFRISTAFEIFHNERLQRRFAPEDVKILLAHMVERGRAEWIGSESSSSKSRGKDSGASKDEAWIWWKTPEEWATDIQTWIEDTGQRNAILTFYELVEGDATISQEFHGIPREILQSSLKVLTKRGKAAIFGEEDQLGVKFY